MVQMVLPDSDTWNIFRGFDSGNREILKLIKILKNYAGYFCRIIFKNVNKFFSKNKVILRTCSSAKFSNDPLEYAKMSLLIA